MAVPHWLTSLFIEDRGQYVLSPIAMDILNEHAEMVVPKLTVADWMAWRARLARELGLNVPETTDV